jgi:hypothetical protein
MSLDYAHLCSDFAPYGSKVVESVEIAIKRFSNLNVSLKVSERGCDEETIPYNVLNIMGRARKLAWMDPDAFREEFSLWAVDSEKEFLESVIRCITYDESVQAEFVSI